MSDIPVDERGAERPVEATEPDAAETEAPEVPLQVVEKPAESAEPKEGEDELPPGTKEFEVRPPTPGDPGNVHEIIIAQLQAMNQLLVQMVGHMAAIRNEFHEIRKKKGD